MLFIAFSATDPFPRQTINIVPVNNNAARWAARAEASARGGPLLATSAVFVPRLLEGVPYVVEPYYGSDCHFRYQPFSGGHSAAEKAIKNIEMLPTHKEPRSNGAVGSEECPPKHRNAPPHREPLQKVAVGSDDDFAKHDNVLPHE